MLVLGSSYFIGKWLKGSISLLQYFATYRRTERRTDSDRTRPSNWIRYDEIWGKCKHFQSILVILIFKELNKVSVCRNIYIYVSWKKMVKLQIWKLNRISNKLRQLMGAVKHLIYTLRLWYITIECASAQYWKWKQNLTKSTGNSMD